MAMGLLTQEDPIGIAGGLNLYGYANGDPINFGYPFGLDPCEEHWDPKLEDEEKIKKWIECKGRQYEAEDAEEQAQARRRDQLKQCTVASAELAARLVVDAALVYAWGSGVQTVARGTLLMAEGAEISTGLIHTATANSAAALGGAELLAGRALVARGVGTVALPLSVGDGVSLFPTNTASFIGVHRSTCGD